MLDVLLPGEATLPFRQNSTQVNFVIRGNGEAEVAGRTTATSLHDVWNTPSMAIYRHRNIGTETYVRLTYSNAALLEMMNIHVVEENPAPPAPRPAGGDADDAAPTSRSPFDTFQLTDDGAWPMRMSG